jgi:hypothetical protein
VACSRVNFTFTFTHVLLRRVIGIDGGAGDDNDDDNDEVTGIGMV